MSARRRRSTLARSSLGAAVLALVGFCPVSGSPADEAQGPRAPFALALPEVAPSPVTALEMRIPSAEVRLVHLYVRNPYAERINYGRIYTAINGEAANTVRRVRARSDGYLLELDLSGRPHLRLHPGKNVVEISAIDRDGRSFYASYVVVAGTRVGGATGARPAAALYSAPVASGSDREPPTVHLLEPNEPVVRGRGPATISVRGTAVDRGGAVASVKVNGKPARLGPPGAADRGLGLSPGAAEAAAGTGVSSARSFEATVAIAATVDAVVVEAADAAGNVARVSIPVRGRESSAPERFTGRKLAVVVGISRYRHASEGIANLRFCSADARAVRDLLVSPRGGGFSDSDIVYLEDESATVDAVRGALEAVARRARAEDLILVYLAGHGTSDPRSPRDLYFVMHDTRPQSMADTALPMKEVADLLSVHVRAERVVLFVDACHSAGLRGEPLVGTRSLENNLVNLYAEKLFQQKGAAILTSSDVQEKSRESERWGGGHGVFTFALLEGLRGRADADADDLITAGELFGYVQDRVRIETAFEQNPRALPGLNRDLVLAAAPPAARRR